VFAIQHLEVALRRQEELRREADRDRQAKANRPKNRREAPRTRRVLGLRLSLA
jgi:hypothetical protein